MKNALKFVSTVGFGLLVVLISGCSNSTSTNTEVSSEVADNNKTAANPDAQNPEPTFKFEETDVDFGVINEGENIKHTYKFTNVGNEDLVIRTVRASCGCTVPTWNKEPIRPGKSGEIEVIFNSKNKPGNQVKNVTVVANTNPPETVLTFRATVLKNE